MGQYVAKLHRAGLRTLVVIAMVATLGIDNPTLVQLVDGGLVFGFFVMAELCLARLRNDERRVWVAEAIIGLAVAWYAMFGVINFGRGISMFVVFGIGMVLWVMGRIASNHESWKVFANPLRVTGVLMPLATVAIAIGRHTFVGHEWYGRNCLALMLPAAFYLWRGIEDRRKSLMVLSAIIFNANLILLWHDLSWTDAQFYMIPIGATIIALGRLLRRDMPTKAFEAMNYIGSLMILVSPMFHILGGSWIHMFSLMVASVCVVLLSIGWRVRALVYTGSAFLIADLVAMVVRGSVDNPSVLWIAGLILGGMVVALGAVAERNRELVLQRMRMVSAALDTWK
jgi:hypothetical protein